MVSDNLLAELAGVQVMYTSGISGGGGVSNSKLVFSHLRRG